MFHPLTLATVILATSVAALLPSFASETETSRPNILFILADDLGIRDSSVYGSEFYETPAMERLAEAGMVFTNAYSANPLCSPTRASIMTCRYPERIPMTAAGAHHPQRGPFLTYPPSAHPSHRMMVPNSRRSLSEGVYTLAHALLDGGYRTAFIGKWHLGATPDLWPEHYGFEINIGGTGSPGPPSFFSPYHNPRLSDGPAGEHLADRLTQEAIDFMGMEDDRPFFICLWYFDVHSPFQARPDRVEALTEKALSFDPPMSATMGAMVEALDGGLGTLLDYLGESGLLENTLIVFTSDNGGNTYDIVDWAVPPTDNFPYRAGKGNIYEGGIRVPTIVKWANQTTAGSRSDTLLHSFDWYPTFLEAAGLEPPDKVELDGVSLVEHLRGGAAPKRNTLFWHFPHNVLATGNRAATAMREGDWKLIRFYFEGPGDSHGFELYNLREDPGETDNLAAHYPDRVAAMDAAITAHLKETGAAAPKLNPEYDPDVIDFNHTWASHPEAAVYEAEGRIVVEAPEGAILDARRRIHTRLTDQLYVAFRLQTTVDGPGWLYYNRFNHRDERVALEPIADGELHDYRVALPPDTKIRAIQITSGEGPGQMILENIRLIDETGRVWWDPEAPIALSHPRQSR